MYRRAVAKSKTRVIKLKEYKNDTIIRKAFLDNKGRYGRLRLNAYISMKYNIYINPRSLGRDLKRLNLIYKIRKQRRKNEIKNTKFVLPDIVKRDYNDKLNRNIFATDVSYIKALKDVKDNCVFLSVIIEHKTKKIRDFKLSVNNDLDLVMDNINTFMSIDKDFIIHSDHGFQYTLKMYIDKINKMGENVYYPV
ncbi:hypothetical protein [Mycoplasma tauri]|uniref:hypothetical protein n=1 Tax=Mycoplasma tauri TaxID=547987 RepID=UPI001CC079C2|nr:hypothetical protein [Mycoplasma tauri]